MLPAACRGFPLEIRFGAFSGGDVAGVERPAVCCKVKTADGAVRMLPCERAGLSPLSGADLVFGAGGPRRTPVGENSHCVQPMAESLQHLAMVLHLARASEHRRRPFVRDKLLLIAGAEAVDLGLEQIGEYCRHKILEHNPGHLLRHFPSLSAARHDEHFLAQLRQAQRAYPREKVEHMLSTLGIQLGRERDTYFTDHEYAASLLGTTPEELESLFGSQPGATATENGPTELIHSGENPYLSPAEDDAHPASMDERRIQRRFPLPVGRVVLLSLAISVLLAATVAVLWPILRVFFRGP